MNITRRIAILLLTALIPELTAINNTRAAIANAKAKKSS